MKPHYFYGLILLALSFNTHADNIYNINNANSHSISAYNSSQYTIEISELGNHTNPKWQLILPLTNENDSIVAEKTSFENNETFYSHVFHTPLITDASKFQISDNGFIYGKITFEYLSYGKNIVSISKDIYIDLKPYFDITNVGRTISSALKETYDCGLTIKLLGSESYQLKAYDDNKNSLNDIQQGISGENTHDILISNISWNTNCNIYLTAINQYGITNYNICHEKPQEKETNIEITSDGYNVNNTISAYLSRKFQIENNSGTEISNGTWRLNLPLNNNSWQIISTTESEFILDAIENPSLYKISDDGVIYGKITYECNINNESVSTELPLMIDAKPFIKSVKVTNKVPTGEYSNYDLYFDVDYIGSDGIYISKEDEYGSSTFSQFVDEQLLAHVTVENVISDYFTWIDIIAENEFGTTKYTLETNSQEINIAGEGIDEFSTYSAHKPYKFYIQNLSSRNLSNIKWIYRLPNTNGDYETITQTTENDTFEIPKIDITKTYNVDSKKIVTGQIIMECHDGNTYVTDTFNLSLNLMPIIKNVDILEKSILSNENTYNINLNINHEGGNKLIITSIDNETNKSYCKYISSQLSNIYWCDIKNENTTHLCIELINNYGNDQYIVTIPSYSISKIESISEKNNDIQITLINNSINISNSENISNVIIYNLMGTKIKQYQEFANINISEFPNGMYIVACQMLNGDFMSKKIIKR